MSRFISLSSTRRIFGMAGTCFELVVCGRARARRFSGYGSHGGGRGRFPLQHAGEAGEFKDFVHCRGERGKRRLAAGGLEFFRGGQEYAQAGAAGVVEVAAVEDELARARGKQDVDSFLEDWAGETVELAGQREHRG